MDCVSKSSKRCVGVGQPIWGGKCSNCADYDLMPQYAKERQDKQNERDEKVSAIRELAQDLTSGIDSWR